MDILAFPDLVLREIVKRVEIKDRLRLRATCRAFEKLVADSNAFHFYNGHVFHLKYQEANPFPNRRLRRQMGTSSLIMCSSDGNFADIRLTTGGLHLIERLFKRISFDELSISLSDSNSIFELICELFKKFHIKLLHFDVTSSKQFEMARYLLKTFPSCKYNMFFDGSQPDIEKIRSLPPAEELKLSNRYNRNLLQTAVIPSELFFVLLSTHKNLSVSNADLNSNDVIKIIQIISADIRKRKVKLVLEPQTIGIWLRDYGIGEDVEEGEYYREFEITRTQWGAASQLRYRNCIIRLGRFNRMGGSYEQSVQWKEDIIISNIFAY